MRRHPQRVFVVTDAAGSQAEDRRRRERAYLVKMGIRTLCLVLAVVLFAVHAAPVPVLVILLGAAILLPWVSVVAANAGATPRPPGRPERADVYRRAVGGSEPGAPGSQRAGARGHERPGPDGG